MKDLIADATRDDDRPRQSTTCTQDDQDKAKVLNVLRIPGFEACPDTNEEGGGSGFGAREPGDIN